MEMPRNRCHFLSVRSDEYFTPKALAQLLFMLDWTPINLLCTQSPWCVPTSVRQPLLHDTAGNLWWTRPVFCVYLRATLGFTRTGRLWSVWSAGCSSLGCWYFIKLVTPLCSCYWEPWFWSSSRQVNDELRVSASGCLSYDASSVGR